MENSAEVPAGQRAGRDKKGKPQKGTRKQQGELAEMRFMLKAARLGFGVAKPWRRANATTSFWILESDSGGYR
jgi:hypothetical protein